MLFVHCNSINVVLAEPSTKIIQVMWVNPRGILIFVTTITKLQ